MERHSTRGDSARPSWCKAWSVGSCQPTERRALPWFVATGFLNGGSLFLMYLALAAGKVSTVSPIVATYPLFTLLLAMLMLQHERATPRVALGAVLTVAGVILLLSA